MLATASPSSSPSPSPALAARSSAAPYSAGRPSHRSPLLYSSQPFQAPSSRSRKANPGSPGGRHSAAVTTSSSSSSVTVSSPATAPQPSAPPRVDAGTQYTPPDWPPTSSRSSLRNPPPLPTLPLSSSGPQEERRGGDDPKPRALAPPDTQEPSPVPPDEPRLRVTPSSTLHNANNRRPRSPTSSPGEDHRSSHPTSPSASKRMRQDHKPDGDDATASGPSSSKQSSSSSRTSTAASKTMPADYSTCDPKILASIIAEMLMRLIAVNDGIPLRDGQLTRFHSRAAPAISVHDYLARLTFHATLSPPILLSMVFFIDRLSSNFSRFMINSLTVHRFLITAATVASKGLSDTFWMNQTYARVGGVSVKELALLELELLVHCDWKIVPKPEDLVEYYQGLVAQSTEYVLEGKPPLPEPAAEPDGLVEDDSDAAAMQVEVKASPPDDPMDTR